MNATYDSNHPYLEWAPHWAWLPVMVAKLLATWWEARQASARKRTR
jgi:hypothetical protein